MAESHGEAQGTALSRRQIGEALAASKGLERSTVMIEQMRKNAMAVVHRRERTGTLIPSGRLVQEDVRGLLAHARVAAHLQRGNALHGVGKQGKSVIVAHAHDLHQGQRPGFGRKCRLIAGAQGCTSCAPVYPCPGS
jgi:hypothetical protein